MPKNDRRDGHYSPSAEPPSALIQAVAFQEHPITVITWEEQPVFIVREVGSALGYAGEGRGLVELISGDWKDDFIEKQDYEVLVNGRLAEFKRRLNSLGFTQRVDPRTPSLLILTESGLNMVLIKSDKPVGRAMRRWVVAELLPAWREQRTTPETTQSTKAMPPKCITLTGKLSAKDVRRLNLQDAAEQLANTVYPTFGEPNPALTEAALRKPHALTDLLTGLVLRLVRHEETPQAELLVVELATVLGRSLPEVAEGAPVKEIPFARARVLLDGAPEHLVLHGLVKLNAIHAALKGPWVGKHEETVRIANEMFELHQRIAYKLPFWQKELDYTVSDLTDAMKAHPNHARLLAMVVRDIAERTPERWLELFLHEQRRHSPRRLTVKKEVA